MGCGSKLGHAKKAKKKSYIPAKPKKKGKKGGK